MGPARVGQGEHGICSLFSGGFCAEHVSAPRADTCCNQSVLDEGCGPGGSSVPSIQRPHRNWGRYFALWYGSDPALVAVRLEPRQRSNHAIRTFETSTQHPRACAAPTAAAASRRPAVSSC